MRFGAAVGALVVTGALGCDEIGTLPGGDAGPLRLTLSAHLQPAEEATWCRYLLPARDVPDGLTIERVAHRSLGGGATHHVIWYQMAETPESVADRLGPFRCDTGIHLRKAGILYAPPSSSGELRWPEGVAAHLPRDAVTLVEWHVINYHPGPVDASVELEIGAAESGTSHLRAGTLLFYDWFVYLPPLARHTSRTRCRVADDITLTWASQHMHQRGVGFVADLLDAQRRPLRRLLETDRWDADPVWFDEPIRIGRGQWIEFACAYDNASDRAVIEGDQADDEMCMFVGGYYPQITTPFGETCIIGDGSGPRFTGESSCAESLTCLQRARDRVEAHACWNGTRGDATDALVALAWRCASAECPERCARTGFVEGCFECLAGACKEELAACRGPPIDER